MEHAVRSVDSLADLRGRAVVGGEGGDHDVGEHHVEGVQADVGGVGGVGERES